MISGTVTKKPVMKLRRSQDMSHRVQIHTARHGREREPIVGEDGKGMVGQITQEKFDRQVAHDPGNDQPDRKQRHRQRVDAHFRQSRVSFAAAASTAGRLRRKTNRAAPGRFSPRSIASVSVAPDRETPGTSAAACAMPIANASPYPTESSERVCAAQPLGHQQSDGSQRQRDGHDGRRAQRLTADEIAKHQSDDDRPATCR